MTEPTDDELVAFATEEEFLLFCDEDEFVQIARAVLAKWGTPAGAGAENLELRRMLCVAHAGAAAYMDDGEAQDNRDLPMIDFLRDSPPEIRDKLNRRALKKLTTPQPTQAQAGAVPLADEQIDAVADRMPGGLEGFLKGWGWRQFAREILTLRRMPDWEPQFDCMTPEQEKLAVQFCQEIAGPLGKRGSPPDPVRLLEMAEALYKAERIAAHGIKGGQHG
jgi:hypothetical protein